MSEYDVVLLVEQPFTAHDAANVRSLHEDIEDPVRYHVMLPVEDASARVENAMGSLATGEVLATPAVAVGEADLEGLRKELLDTCRAGRGRHRQGDRGGRRPGRRRAGDQRPDPRAGRQGGRGRRRAR